LTLCIELNNKLLGKAQVKGGEAKVEEVKKRK